MIEIRGHKIISVEEAKDLFSLKEDINLSVPMVREACDLLQIRCLRGGTIFFDMALAPPDKSELDMLVKTIAPQIPSYNSIVVYYKRPSPVINSIVYYLVAGFESSNLEDLKKIIKIHSLKAFA
jgi:hypothetical protein